MALTSTWFQVQTFLRKICGPTRSIELVLSNVLAINRMVLFVGMSEHFHSAWRGLRRRLLVFSLCRVPRPRPFFVVSLHGLEFPPLQVCNDKMAPTRYAARCFLELDEGGPGIHISFQSAPFTTRYRTYGFRRAFIFPALKPKCPLLLNILDTVVI